MQPTFQTGRKWPKTPSMRASSSHESKFLPNHHSARKSPILGTKDDIPMSPLLVRANLIKTNFTGKASRNTSHEDKDALPHMRSHISRPPFGNASTNPLVNKSHAISSSPLSHYSHHSLPDITVHPLHQTMTPSNHSNH